MLRPRVTFSRNGMTSSIPSGPPNERTRSASYARGALSKSGAQKSGAPRVVIGLSTLTQVADIELRKFFVDRHEHAVVAIAFAGRGGSFEELADDGGHGYRSGVLGGRGTRDAEVLPVQIDAESRFELVSYHGWTLEFEHPAGGQSAGEHLDDLVRVDAGLGAKYQCLAHGRVIDGHDDLVTGLDDLTGSRPADVDDSLAHRLEERHCSVEVLSVATDHDTERTGDGTLVTAADWRVERPCTALTQRSVDLDRSGGRDGAHVDEQMLLAHHWQHAVLAEDDVADIR